MANTPTVGKTYVARARDGYKINVQITHVYCDDVRRTYDCCCWGKTDEGVTVYMFYSHVEKQLFFDVYGAPYARPCLDDRYYFSF